MRKRYPFSMRLNGHNIELAYNYLRCKVHDIYTGDAEWDDKIVDEFEELRDVYARAIHDPVFWATGHEYGILKRANEWAVNYRDVKNALGRE